MVLTRAVFEHPWPMMFRNDPIALHTKSLTCSAPSSTSPFITGSSDEVISDSWAASMHSEANRDQRQEAAAVRTAWAFFPGRHSNWGRRTSTNVKLSTAVAISAHQREGFDQLPVSTILEYWLNCFCELTASFALLSCRASRRSSLIFSSGGELSFRARR